MSKKEKMKVYDVIIAGASFAGLATASKIKNKEVLLIDKEDIGSHVRSACGTLVKTMEKINCEESIIQNFDIAVIHTKNKEIEIPLADKFCTIDFKKFCMLFLKQSNAEFVKANVIKTDGKIVYTSIGNFKSDIIVDCTGWPAVLASSLKKDYVHKKMLSFGIETEIPYKDNKLRFFLDQGIIKNGAAWLFPAENKSRFGVGSYQGDTRILRNLKKFVGSYNLKIGKIHGGYFCYCLKEPIVENIFVAGCATGCTLPLSGEGIRRSIGSGQLCGSIIQRILDKKISFKQGQEEYAQNVLNHRKYYDFLLKTQNKLKDIKNWKLNLIFRLLSIKPVAKYFLRRYEEI